MIMMTKMIRMMMMMIMMMMMMMMRIDRSEDLVISAAIMAGFLPAADTEELRHQGRIFCLNMDRYISNMDISKDIFFSKPLFLIPSHPLRNNIQP